MAIAIGAAEKGVAQLYETVFRPPEKRHPPWIGTVRHANARGARRAGAGCQARAGQWLIGPRLTQADITATCVYTFLNQALAVTRTAIYPGLAALAERCEALPEFRANKAGFFPPGDGT